MPEAAQRQSLVRVEGVPDYFATRTGGNVTSATTKTWNGGDPDAALLSAPAETDDITIGRPYKPERDQEIVRRLKKLCGRWRTTLSEQDTDADFAPLGEPQVWPNALLREVHAPETDAGSGAEKRLELVFAVSASA